MGVGTDRAVRLARDRLQRLRRIGGLRYRRDHGRHRAQAGHEPRRPAQHERRHREVRRGERREDFTQRDHHRGLEPARRDVLRRDEGERLSARARDRHGRRARHGALPLVPRRGARRLRARHPGDGARRTWRHDGSADQLHDRQRHPDHAVPRQGEARRDRRSRPQRRRRDREVPQDRLRVLRAVVGRRADRRGDRARPEAHPAVLRVARRRIRHEGALPRRAGEARPQGNGENH